MLERLNNANFFEELVVDPKTKDMFRENLLTKNSSDNFFQMQKAFSKNAQINTENAETQYTQENLQTISGMNLKSPSNMTTCNDTTHEINNSYFNIVKDLIDHAKKVHFKVLTYSVGRDLTDQEVDEYIQSNLTKKDEDGNTVSMELNYSKMKVGFNPDKMKKMCKTVDFFLDRLFSFFTKYIDQNEKKQRKIRTKNMVDDYKEVVIYDNYKITSLESVNDYLKNQNFEQEQLLNRTQEQSLCQKNLYQTQITSLREKVIELAKELETRQIAIVELKSELNKQEIQIENLRMKNMSTCIVEQKLTHMGNKFFNQVSFIFNKYSDVIAYIKSNVDKFRNLWMQITYDKNPRNLIDKHNCEFANLFKTLKDAVDNYEFNKHKVNLKLYKNFISDFDLKNFKMDVEINKKFAKHMDTINFKRTDDKFSIITETDRMLDMLNFKDPKNHLAKFNDKKPQTHTPNFSQNIKNANLMQNTTPNIFNKDPMFKFNIIEPDVSKSSHVFLDKKRQNLLNKNFHKN